MNEQPARPEPAPPAEGASSGTRMAEARVSLPIGLAAGFFGGLVGLGGGIIMIPLMTGVSKLRQHQAHGTSLVALVFTGISGAITYWLKGGAVDVAGAIAMAVPAVATARFGARYAHALPEWKLKRAFGGFLIFVSLLLIFKQYIPHTAAPMAGLAKVGVLAVVGAFTGFISGMMGVGGGSLMVPAMVLVTGFPQFLAQGTSLLAMIPAGATGAHAHWQLGNVVKRLLPGLIPGILVGTFLGGSLARHLGENLLPYIFAAVVIYTGLRYVRAKRPPVATAR
jgi:uncharacterized protein